MKIHPIVYPVVAVVLFNGLLAMRDVKSINSAHERVCATLPQPHPDCPK